MKNQVTKNLAVQRQHRRNDAVNHVYSNHHATSSTNHSEDLVSQALVAEETASTRQEMPSDKVRLPEIDIHKRSGSYDTHIVNLKNGQVAKVHKLNTNLKNAIEKRPSILNERTNEVIVGAAVSSSNARSGQKNPISQVPRG